MVVTRPLEQLTDARSELFVIDDAFGLELAGRDAELLGELAGVVSQEPAQVVRPRLRSPHQKCKLPHRVTPRAARHRYAARSLNRGVPAASATLSSPTLGALRCPRPDRKRGA